MKWLIFLFFASVALSSNGQPGKKMLFQPVDPAGMTGVPGTRISIRCPEGFRLSNHFAGLQSPNAVIELYDLAGGRFNVIVGDFSKDKLEAQGARIRSEEEVEVGPYRGRLIALENADARLSMVLVFGNESFAVIGVATYTTAKGSAEQLVRETLMSIRYDALTRSANAGSASFLLDDSHSDFRFAKRSVNNFYYTPATSIQGAYVVATELVWDYTTTPAAIGGLMLEELSRHGLTAASVRRKASRQINGYKAFESEIEALKDGVPCVIYQMVVVNAEKAVVVHGIDSGGNSRKRRDAFRRFAHTIRFL